MDRSYLPVDAHRRRPMETPNSQPRVTYILPTTACASLLEVITRDAPAGSGIEVHTEAMHTFVEQTLRERGRTDIRVCFREPRPPAMRPSGS